MSRRKECLKHSVLALVEQIRDPVDNQAVSRVHGRARPPMLRSGADVTQRRRV